MSFLTWLFILLGLVPTYHSMSLAPRFGGIDEIATTTNWTLTQSPMAKELKTGVKDVLASWDRPDGTTDYVYNAGTLPVIPNELSHNVDDRNNIIRSIVAPNGKTTFLLGEKGYSDDTGWHTLGSARLYTVDFQADMAASTTPISVLWNWFTGIAHANNSTFNPSAGANDPVDGDIENAVQVDFATARGAAQGTAKSVTATADSQPGARQRTGATFDVTTAIFCFATGTIGAGATVSSTTLSVFAATGGNLFSAGNTTYDWVNVYSQTLASNADIALTDFPNRGTTPYSSQVPINAQTPSNAYLSWTFNSAGNTYVNVTGDTCLATEIGYDASNSPPTAVGATWMTSTWADNGSSKPILSVTFTPAPPASSALPQQNPLLIQF